MKTGTFFSQIDMAVENGEAETISDILETYACEGMTFVDLQAAELDVRFDIDSLMKMLKNSGICVGSMFHSIEFNYSKKDAVEELREDTKKRLEQCAKAECGIFMPVPIVRSNHPSSEERRCCREIVTQYIGEVAELSKQFNITTVIENFSDTRCPFSTVDDIAYILDNIQICKYVLDTGNFWFGGNSALEASKRFAEKTVHVHLKDILPKDDGYIKVCGRKCDSVAIGSGIIPFVEIFDELKKKNYDKTVTVEINDRRDLIAKTVQSLKYLKSIEI